MFVYLNYILLILVFEIECRVTGNQVFYFLGLKYASATVACALSNLLPAFTFFLALLFRLVGSK